MATGYDQSVARIPQKGYTPYAIYLFPSLSSLSTFIVTVQYSHVSTHNRTAIKNQI